MDWGGGGGGGRWSDHSSARNVPARMCLGGREQV